MTDRYQIVWSETALQDAEIILEYISQRDSVGAAAAVHAKLIAKVETLSVHPERCRIVPELKSLGIDEFQELIVKPYRLCFRIHDKDVVLVSVLDGRRDLAEILLDRALQS